MRRFLAPLLLLAACEGSPAAPSPAPLREPPAPPAAPACWLSDAQVTLDVPQDVAAPRPIRRVPVKRVEARSLVLLPADATVADATPPPYAQAATYGPSPDRGLMALSRRVVQQARGLAQTETPAGALRLDVQGGGARLLLTNHF